MAECLDDFDIGPQCDEHDYPYYDEMSGPYLRYDSFKSLEKIVNKV